MDIVFEHGFKKKLKKISPKIKKNFYERLTLFELNKFNPILSNHSVEKKFPGCRSINVTGDYRAIFKEISSDAVIFMLIGTHSEFY